MLKETGVGGQIYCRVLKKEYPIFYPLWKSIRYGQLSFSPLNTLIDILKLDELLPLKVMSSGAMVTNTDVSETGSTGDLTT